jgi:hypothetical protein
MADEESDYNEDNSEMSESADNSAGDGKAKTTEETYTKLTQHEHIMVRPDTYSKSYPRLRCENRSSPSPTDISHLIERAFIFSFVFSWIHGACHSAHVCIGRGKREVGGKGNHVHAGTVQDL